MSKHRVYSMSVASVYPHYIAKAEKKGRTKAEVDEIICWLTGYSQTQLHARCRVRLILKLSLPRLIDELAGGKAMVKILRKDPDATVEPR